MRLTVEPDPFDPLTGFTIEVHGGQPPYLYTVLPSPPNPPGVVLVAYNGSARVEVGPSTPPGTVVQVEVRDGSSPPQTRLAVSTVA